MVSQWPAVTQARGKTKEMANLIYLIVEQDGEFYLNNFSWFPREIDLILIQIQPINFMNWPELLWTPPHSLIFFCKIDLGKLFWIYTNWLGLPRTHEPPGKNPHVTRAWLCPTVHVLQDISQPENHLHKTCLPYKAWYVSRWWDQVSHFTTTKIQAIEWSHYSKGYQPIYIIFCVTEENGVGPRFWSIWRSSFRAAQSLFWFCSPATRLKALLIPPNMKFIKKICSRSDLAADRYCQPSNKKSAEQDSFVLVPIFCHQGRIRKQCCKTVETQLFF